ncbi:MAG TPA: hypothetical protein VKY74_15565 [Chloroflexia bacterium]|nr:hypothetical protein [Chloroflexia bacterium]
MSKQPRFRDLWMNQTRLGQRFGMSAIAIGRKLDALGLRGGDRQPTAHAIDGGFCQLTPLKDGTPFYLWSVPKVGALLQEGGAVVLSPQEQDAYEIACALLDLERHPDVPHADKLWALTVDETPKKMVPLVDRFLAQLGAKTRLGGNDA